MPKKLTTEQFVAKAREIHGDKYDYSKVVYVNAKTKVCVTCKEHGDFWITADDFTHGKGCRTCYHTVYGVGISDLPHIHGTDAYNRWHGMLKRCYYSKEHTQRRQSYSDCIVCPEWLRFSVFKEWFDKNYIQGYALDKDIISKGNRVYSPDTCCFVPQEINGLIIQNKSRRNSCPIGVFPIKYSNRTKYRASMNDVYIGTYDTPEEAFQAYKSAKEQKVKELATQYFQEGKITQRVYHALMEYQVEITD